jgi:hypothetical protein
VTGGGLEQRLLGRRERAIRWNSGLITPYSTASRVNRYEVPRRHADPGAAPGQRCHGRDGGRGPGVVNNAGEQHLELRHGPCGGAIEVVINDRVLRFPEPEAC